MDRPLVEPFLRALFAHEGVQSLWRIRDAGVPVFAHSVDVAHLALDALPEWEERHGRLHALAIIVGAMLHDVTKARTREAERRGDALVVSHSTLMRLDPEAAAVAAHDILADIKRDYGYALAEGEKRLVWDIVMSHHGAWGGHPPQSREAQLVHQCDLASARAHRAPALDANDVLPLLDQGCSQNQAARILGTTPATIRACLRRACQAEWVDSTEELLATWRRRGSVATGDEAAHGQRTAIRRMIAYAGEAPDCLLRHPAFIAWQRHEP